MTHINRNIKRIIKRSILFIASFFIFYGCGSQVQKIESSNYQTKIMTFNIRYGNANDGENSWLNRKNILLDVIKDYNTDLLGMQEVLKFQLDELLEELPSYSFTGVGRDDGKSSGEFSPILYSKDRYILDTTETFWFSDTPDIPGSKHWGNNYTRICTWAKFFDKFEGRSFYFMNLHLDHESSASRIKSAEALVKKIAGFNDKLPIIITGDFNTGEDDETIKIVLNNGFTDSYRKLNLKTTNEGTYHSFIGDDKNEKIDFIFISEGMNCIDSKIIKTNRSGKYPSDHFPVTAIVNF